MVCLEETSGSLTLPGEVMSVGAWGPGPGGDCRYARASPASIFCLSTGLVTSHCPIRLTPNIVDQLPKLDIKSQTCHLPKEARTEWNFCATQGQPQMAPPPDIPLPADSASAPKPPTDIWLRPSFGMMAVLEPADGYPSKWTATSWTDKLDRIPIFPTRLRAAADITATLARRVSNAVQGQSWLRRTGVWPIYLGSMFGGINHLTAYDVGVDCPGHRFVDGKCVLFLVSMSAVVTRRDRALRQRPKGGSNFSVCRGVR